MYSGAVDEVGVELIGANLARANLASANLEKAALSEATLSETDLTWAHLDFADLHNSDLSRACLNYASLFSAELTYANLSHSSLMRTILERASLYRADVSESILFQTGLIDSNLAGVKGLESCIHNGPSAIDHRTLAQSGRLPMEFLQGCGLPEDYIAVVPRLYWENPVEFYTCFISYSHADQEFAVKLERSLQKCGIRCWKDDHHMLPGDDIHEALEDTIARADKLLLCCSENSLNSRWVDKEIAIAFDKEEQLSKKRGKTVRVLIPLDLDGYLFTDQWTSGYRAQIRRRLAADFIGWEKDEAKFNTEMEKVVKALRTDDGAREKAPEGKL